MMACVCQVCSKEYMVDLIVPDSVWARIGPPARPDGGGLICGPCIMESLELRNEHDAFRLMRM